jgi:hypothetical protein
MSQNCRTDANITEWARHEQEKFSWIKTEPGRGVNHPPPCSEKVKVKWSRYRPGMTQRVGRVTALLFHDRGTRRGVVSSTPPPHFTPRKDPAPILQVAGWAPGPVWTGGKSRPHRDSIPDCLARSSVAILTKLPGTHTYTHTHTHTHHLVPRLKKK